MSSIIDRRPLLSSSLFGACSLGLALTLGCLAENGPPSITAASPPHGGSTERGRRLFVQSCAHCHGDDARGTGEDGDGPDLAGLRIGNARIAAVIRSGIPGEMPSFARKHPEADIADLTAYLRSVR
jgi:mono/diheme cytochrome c family protein